LTSGYLGYESMQTVGALAISTDGSDLQFTAQMNDNVDIRLGYITQDQALFGTQFDGMMGIDTSQTQFIGIDSTKQFSTWYMKGSYTTGVSSINSGANSYIKNSNNIMSQSYYIGVGKNYEQSAVEFRLGTQLHVTNGAINYSVPTEYDWTTDTTHFTHGTADASTNRVPYVAELDFAHKFNEHTSWTNSLRLTTDRQDTITSVQSGIEVTF